MYHKLNPDHHLIFINSSKYSQNIQEIHSKIRFLNEYYQKSFKNLTSFYYGNYYEKHKGSGTSCQFSFRLPITFRSFLSLMIHNQAIDASIQRDF